MPHPWWGVAIALWGVGVALAPRTVRRAAALEPSGSLPAIS